jgi:hypothetical protein
MKTRRSVDNKNDAVIGRFGRFRRIGGFGRRRAVGIIAVVLACAACSEEVAEPVPTPPLVAGRFTDVTRSNLPVNRLGGQCMDATTGDLDGDGDLDLVLAQENATNLVLLNDGAAMFATGSLEGGDGDNEEVRLADLDADGDLDLVSVHEDDQVHAVFENDGLGGYIEVDGMLPNDLRSTANALELLDLDVTPDSTDPGSGSGDGGGVEMLIGNAGPNLVLSLQADGTFVDRSSVWPTGADTTQDLLVFDGDGDGDDDVLVVNEEANVLLINRGDGTFSDESAQRLPAGSSESREAAAADLDGDGDLDVVVANVRFNRDEAPTNQLLINDGSGTFVDATGRGLASVANDASSFTVQLVDVDDDGDIDILSPVNDLGDGGSIDVWANHGDGSFGVPEVSPFNAEPSGSTFDVEVADFNGDGFTDLYFCNRTGSDQLYLGG